ncbi:serine hydrolase domain-containing protein [Planctomycetota bacterium]
MKQTLFLIVVVLLGTFTAAEPNISPESVGLSPNGLAQIKQTFQGLVDEGKIAGALTLISRKGQIAHWETYGYMDLEAQVPMAKDAIFRIASMTKAVTAVAVLQLMEQGHFQLDDPIEKYLSVFEKARVLDPNQEGANPNEPRTVPLDRSITIRDLLRHTAGVQYGGPPYRQAGLHKWDGSLKEFVDTLGDLPLAFQPGAKFKYSYATDVLGHLVEVISGQPLDAYFKDHIFAPLAMHDTGFVVPPDKVSRLTNHYAYQEGKIICKEQAANSPFLKRAQALSGGGGWSYSYPGLVTTPGDWWRFMEMLRNRGQLDDQALLKSKSVKLMCEDHLGDIPGHFEQGTSHGLGVGVITETTRHGHLAGNGMIYWAGAPHNTYYFVDFEYEMCALLFIQNSPFNHLNLMNRFLVLAHKAIDD